MFRFIFGVLVGGLAIWYWSEEIRSVGKKAEDVLDATKDWTSAASKTGQEAIRPSQPY